MYIDKQMLNRIKNDLKMKKETEKERKSVFNSYLHRKGYEICQNEMRRKIGRCERDIENYDYLEYIISQLEDENFDTLDTKNKKMCVKVKDYGQLSLNNVWHMTHWPYIRRSLYKVSIYNIYIYNNIIIKGV